MLSCCNISSGYGKNSQVFFGLNLNFEPNRFTVLLGANGCGKSTLLKTIMGFLPLSQGKILLNDINVRSIKPKKLAKKISYLPQHLHCPDYLTVGELVELGRYANLKESVFGAINKQERDYFIYCLEQVGLQDMASIAVNSLSGGQKQRAWIAMVLAQDSDIILLDEPVNHLDPNYQYSILSLVRKIRIDNNKTVIVVLHDLNQACVFADNACLLKQGQVIANGTVTQSLTADNIKISFDFDIVPIEHQSHRFCLPQTQSYQTNATDKA